VSGVRTITRAELFEKLKKGDDRFRLVMALNEWSITDNPSVRYSAG
jgi:hypothetical protein